MVEMVSKNSPGLNTASGFSNIQKYALSSTPIKLEVTSRGTTTFGSLTIVGANVGLFPQLSRSFLESTVELPLTLNLKVFGTTKPDLIG